MAENVGNDRCSGWLYIVLRVNQMDGKGGLVAGEVEALRFRSSFEGEVAPLCAGSCLPESQVDMLIAGSNGLDIGCNGVR